MCTISSLAIRRVGSRLSTEGPEISIYYILAPIVAARNVDTSIAIGLHTLVKNLVVIDYIYIATVLCIALFPDIGTPSRNAVYPLTLLLVTLHFP